MAALKPWLDKRNCRVITPDGLGRIMSWNGLEVTVKLNSPIAGCDKASYLSGQVVLDTNYMVLKVVTIAGAGKVINGYCVPEWSYALAGINTAVCATGEALYAIDFENNVFQKAGLAGQEEDYTVLAGYMDRLDCSIHYSNFYDFYKSLEFWINNIENIDASDGIYIAVWLDQADGEVLGRATFTKDGVLVKERYGTALFS